MKASEQYLRIYFTDRDTMKIDAVTTYGELIRLETEIEIRTRWDINANKIDIINEYTTLKEKLNLKP
jgi:hypothetical protein